MKCVQNVCNVAHLPVESEILTEGYAVRKVNGKYCEFAYNRPAIIGNRACKAMKYDSPVGGNNVIIRATSLRSIANAECFPHRTTPISSDVDASPFFFLVPDSGGLPAARIFGSNRRGARLGIQGWVSLWIDALGWGCFHGCSRSCSW